MFLVLGQAVLFAEYATNAGAANTRELTCKTECTVFKLTPFSGGVLIILLLL